MERRDYEESDQFQTRLSSAAFIMGRWGKERWPFQDKDTAVDT